jgi:hypothetical protein
MKELIKDALAIICLFGAGYLLALLLYGLGLG